MNKKSILVFGLLFSFSSVFSIQWMNGQKVTFSDWLSCKKLDLLLYNSWNSGDKSPAKRYYGIHDMSVEAGATKIDLIKDDVCLYPHLFTRWAYVLGRNNCIVQRWACVPGHNRWMGFDTKNNALSIKTATSRYKFLSVLTGIGKQEFKEVGMSLKSPITLKINGRAVQTSLDHVVRFCDEGRFVSQNSASASKSSSRRS